MSNMTLGTNFYMTQSHHQSVKQIYNRLIRFAAKILFKKVHNADLWHNLDHGSHVLGLNVKEYSALIIFFGLVIVQKAGPVRVSIVKNLGDTYYNNRFCPSYLRRLKVFVKTIVGEIDWPEHENCHCSGLTSIWPFCKKKWMCRLACPTFTFTTELWNCAIYYLQKKIAGDLTHTPALGLLHQNIMELFMQRTFKFSSKEAFLRG